MKPAPLKPHQVSALIERLGPQWEKDAHRRDETDAFAEEPFQVLKARGFHKLLIPTPLGGLGASYRQTCDAIRGLARYDASAGLAWSMHMHVIAALCFKHRRRDSAATSTLESVAARDLVLATTGGRDWLQSNGSMTKVDGGYRVAAHKAFTSAAQVADIMVASAPYDHPTNGPQVLHFSIPMRTDGLSIREDWRAHGMRSTGSSSLIFDDVFVPEYAISLRRPQGTFHSAWGVVLGVALPLIMAAYRGVGDAALARAVRFAQPRASEPYVQAAVGEAQSASILADVCHDRMVSLANELDFDPTSDRASEVLALKTATYNALTTTVERAMEAAGGAAFYRESGLERSLRDIRAGHYHPLPERAQVQFTGRAALGLPPV